MLEEHMRGEAGIRLAAKVDKIGVGNKMIDFRLTVSHDRVLKKFQGWFNRCTYKTIIVQKIYSRPVIIGSRDVLVILKDMLSSCHTEGIPSSYRCSSFATQGKTIVS